MASNQVWDIAGKQKMSRFKEQFKKFDRKGFPGRYGPIAKCESWHDDIGIELSEYYGLDINPIEKVVTTRHAHKARDDEDGHITKKYVKEQNLYEKVTRRKKGLFLLHTSSPIEGKTQETEVWKWKNDCENRVHHMGVVDTTNTIICGAGNPFRASSQSLLCWLDFSTKGTSITYTKWKEYRWHCRFFLMCIRDGIHLDVCTEYYERADILILSHELHLSSKSMRVHRAHGAWNPGTRQ